jgi:hypothetical protein
MTFAALTKIFIADDKCFLSICAAKTTVAA